MYTMCFVYVPLPMCVVCVPNYYHIKISLPGYILLHAMYSIQQEATDHCYWTTSQNNLINNLNNSKLLNYAIDNWKLCGELLSFVIVSKLLYIMSCFLLRWHNLMNLWFHLDNTTTYFWNNFFFTELPMN